MPGRKCFRRIKRRTVRGRNSLCLLWDNMPMREHQSVGVLERQSVGALERRSVAPTVQLSTVEIDLRRLYERWRDLSDAEAEAIHARNWMNVLNHQNAKK